MLGRGDPPAAGARSRLLFPGVVSEIVLDLNLPRPLGRRGGIWPWRWASEWWEHSARNSVTWVLLSTWLIEV